MASSGFPPSSDPARRPVRRGIERHVNGRAAVADRGIGGEREEPAIDEQMIVRGRDENRPRLDRHLVFDLRDLEPRALLKERAQQVVRLTMTVLHEYDGNAKIGRQAADQLPQGVQPTPGRTDNRDRVCHDSPQ